MSQPAETGGGGMGVARLGLSPQQLNWLLERLSSDDQQDLAKTMKDCTSEMTLTRGLPFACGTMVAMWYARSRLPDKYWVGPKSSVPFYMLIGFGSLCAVNLLSMNTCADRVKPKLSQLYEKYNTLDTGGAADRYTQLRLQNRQGIHAAQADIPSPALVQPLEPARPSPRPLAWDEAPVLSGTPLGPPTSHPDARLSFPPSTSAGGTAYGDKDFS